MYKKTKKFLLPLLLAIMATISVLIPSNTSEAAENDAVYEAIQKRGTLIVGLSADYPPYEFHATVDGKDTIVGFEISIAQDIADDLGVELQIEELGFDSLIGSLKTGKIDLIISGMTKTEERMKEIDFSNPYLEESQKIVIRKADLDKFSSVLDFDGLKVGAQKQTVQESVAQEQLIGANVVSLQKVTDIMTNLNTGKVDAAVVEGMIAEAYISFYPDLYTLANVDLEYDGAGVTIGMQKNTPLLMESVNGTIAEIKAENRLDGYIAEAADMMFKNDESFFAKYGSYFVRGTGYTIILAVIGVFFGAIIGTFIALMKLSANKLFRIIGTVYVEYLRGTPLLVQIFIVYFGTTVLKLDLSAFTAGCIALSLNSGAYVSEVIRAGIASVDKGQMEAARSLGMNKNLAMKEIIFPQAVKNILPALGNEFVTVIKESSVISVIGVSELMFQTGVVQGASFKVLIPYAMASGIYFILTFSLSRLLAHFEKKLAVTDKH